MALTCLLAAGALHAAGGRIDTTVRAEYPSVLTRWAAGDEAAALEALAAMETALVREKKADRDIDEVWRSKLGVVRDTIGRGGFDVLVPIMLLHHDASRYYYEHGRPRLALHSSLMSSELAQFYAQKSEADHAAAVAADQLVSLAGHNQHGLMVRRAATLYFQALELDPTNLAAHMGLASMYERRAELSKALEHYEKACRIAPQDPEPWLRHALTAVRAEDTDAALAGLDRVLNMDAPAWMRRLALQMKADLHSGDAAVGTARRALDEFPTHSRQAIQMAFLLEQRRQPNQALEVLETIGSDSEAESERYRYTRWPEQALTASRERLRSVAGERRAMLETATLPPPAEAAPGE